MPIPSTRSKEHTDTRGLEDLELGENAIARRPDGVLVVTAQPVDPARSVTTTAIVSSLVAYVVCAGASVVTFLNIGSKTTMLLALWTGGVGGTLATVLGLGAGFLAVFRTRKVADSRLASVARAALYLSVGASLAVIVLVALGVVIATLLQGVK